MANNPEKLSDVNHHRRASLTAQAFTTIFRPTGVPVPPFPAPINIQDQRRRLSLTTATLGLSGTSPTQTTPFAFDRRRSSASDRSDSIDETAIEDDESPNRGHPATPFARRISFGARVLRGGSPASNAECGFNWSEQLRSRAESSVSQSQRPVFPTQVMPKTYHSPAPASTHERERSVVELPPPPVTVPPPAPARVRVKPDALQERILKGEFHMD